MADPSRSPAPPTRPQCAAFVGTSLDGFIARSDGRVDWLEAYPPPPGAYERFIAGIDAILIGRETYDLVITFPEWPYGAKPVFVLTHRPPAPVHGERFLAGEPAAVLTTLGGHGYRRIYVDGGAVVSEFLAAGLLDELTVTVVPHVLGAGRRLFQGTLPERRLALVESEAFPSGLVRMAYRAR